MNVGIYGGSFNPFHFGHLTVARKALAELALDRLYVIPAAVSPFKVGLDHGVAALPDRLETVKAAFADEPRVVVDDRELRRGGVSYAIDTVKEILSELSTSSPSFNLNSQLQPPSPLNLYFIIGEDSVEGLPRWKDYEELKRLVTFKAYPRTKESSTEIRRLFTDNRVVPNPDAKMAETVRAGVVRKHGFCPCRLPKNPEFFCPCDEFKAQLADPSFHGLCHCRLYLKP